MWRLAYALHGFSSADTLQAPTTIATSSTRLNCSHASLILEHDESGSQSRDACLLSASTLPDGKIISLHIDGGRAELREAHPLAAISSPTRTNGETVQLRVVAKYPSADAQHGDVIDIDSGEGVQLLPLQTTPWRQVDSTQVISENADGEPLQRLRHYGEFEPVVSLLALDAVYQLHLEPLEKTSSFNFDRTAVNATALDCWGPHAILVGFSSGEVCVVDWRDPSGGPLMRTTAAEPSLGYPPMRYPPMRGRRRVGSGPSHAGVMSCCALEDNFRVVCGLADHRGTVAVMDLRKAITRSPEMRKRGRTSSAEEALQAAVASSYSTPTLYPACDMRHCRSDFGTIGMVDTGGTGVLTTINVLESGLHNQRRTRSAACWGTPLNSPTAVTHASQSGSSSSSSSSKTVMHTRALRCDVSQGGSFLVTTGASPCSAALTARNGGGSADLEFSLVMHQNPCGGRFTSVSSMGSIICAETDRGHALCVALAQ